jgi:hypothetical protein
VSDLPAIAPRLVLLFVGSGRTGSSMLGQIINHHPACLIAHEARVLTRYVRGEGSFEALLADAAALAWEQFTRGLESTGRFADVCAHTQTKWRSFAPLAADARFAKTRVEVVGDKKAGGASDAYAENAARIDSLLASDERIALVHVVRDPAASARSALRAHGGRGFAAACERIVRQHACAHRMVCRCAGRALRVRYEDLCARPREEVARVLAFLGLEPEARFLDEVTRRVHAEPAVEGEPGEDRLAADLVRSLRAGPAFEPLPGGVGVRA